MCLDWIHALEKLWSCGKAINRGSRTKRTPLETWVHAQKKLLRHGKLNEVLATLQAALDGTAVTGPGNKYRRTVLEDTIHHFTKNRVRMRYQRLRQQGLVIGSGLIEGTVRHLVGMRLDGPGMRWGKGQGPRGGGPSPAVRPSQRLMGRLRVVPCAPRFTPARVEAGANRHARRQEASEDGGLNHVLPVMQLREPL